MMKKLVNRRFPAVGEQQRRNKQHQKQLRVKIDMQAESRPGKQRARGDLHQRQRDLKRDNTGGDAGERHH